MSLVNRPSRPLALLSMLFVGFTGSVFAADYPAPVDVDVVAVAKADETVDVMGRVVALQTGPVAARTSAAVQTAHVNVGDSVNAGDLLVTLYNNRTRSVVALTSADVTQWQAKLKTAEVEATQAQRDLKRLETLRGSSAFNESLYDQRSAAAQAAQARVAEVKASLQYAAVQLKRAQQDLAWTEVKAPYDGVVSERHVSEGAWVALGAPVVSLISTSQLEIEADIPSQYLAHVQAGNALTAKVNGQALQLSLRALLPAERSLSRTRLARLSISLTADAAPPLTVNQSVSVAVPISSKDALTVHKDAVIRNGDMSTVYKVVDGIAQMTPVQLGAAVGDRMQVLGGLEAGDTVVVRGNERLHPGQKVMPRGSQPPVVKP